MVLAARKLDPIGNRVVDLTCRLELPLLNVDGDAGKEAVVSAMVEMEVGVHDGADLA